MQRANRRSTKVCTRYRKRKTKCDFKFPACSACSLANLVCLGYDPTTKQAVPRSLVKSLEAKVAHLEAQMHSFQAESFNTPHLMASKVAQATISAGIPRPGSFYRSKVSPALFFRPSCPPLAVVRGKEQRLSDPPSFDRPISNGHARYNPGTIINLSSVPFSAISRMIQNYIEIHLPQYPCVSHMLLENIVQRISHKELRDTNTLLIQGIPAFSGLSHFEYFILLIVLALSAMTLTWKNDDQARAASESFYSLALKHLQAMNNNSEIQALQISLVLAHYASMCPERVDNWTCISNAIRIVLNMGLHLEPPKGLSIEEMNQRSQLFWVAYGMERSLCTNLRLPLSFSEESISAKFDSISNSTQPLGLDDFTPLSAAAHICRYRALETEVHRILHLEEDLHNFGFPTIEAWIEDITGRLHDWYQGAQLYTQYNMLEFKNVQFYHLIARIHRPTPRLRKRTPKDRQIVLESSLVLIQDYIGQEKRRRLFYPWHGVHILFETAIITLEACWASRDWPRSEEIVTKMLQSSIPQCIQLLRAIGQRWDEASLCANSLAPLMERVVAALTSRSMAMLSLVDEVSITEDIEGLLFSDGPLTWNRESLVDPSFCFPEDADCFGSLLGEGLEFFQWDPEWGIMPSEPL